MGKTENGLKELHLRLEAKKYQILEEKSDFGLWEYDIATKSLIQSRKQDGKWCDSNFVIENYREQIKEWNLIHPEDVRVFDALCDSMDRGDSHFTYELRAVQDDNRFIWLRHEGNTICDEKGKPVRVIGKSLNITAEKQEKELLEREAGRDKLTGLYNGIVCREMAVKRIKDASGDLGALILLDLDDFETVNDKYGYLYGDSILESAASVIYTSFKANDIAGRLCGNSFMVYCPGVSDEKTIGKLLERLFVRLNEFVRDKEGNPVSISAGAGIYPLDGISFETLFYHTDMALAKAKKDGKNRFCIYDKLKNQYDSPGEIYTKMNGGTIYDNKSYKRQPDIFKELFDFSFEVISNKEDFHKDVLKVFAEVSLYLDLDRSTLIEYSDASGKAEVTAKWTRENDLNDKEILEKAANSNWMDLEAVHRVHEFLYIKNGKIELEKFWRDIQDINRVPRSAIQFAVMDESKMAGTITFESWEEKEWTQVEIATLSSITKMLSSYLLRHQSKNELETENSYGSKAMDVQKLVYYAVDAVNFTIKYMSRYARNEYPNVKYGEHCYKALRGKNAPCEECPIAGCIDHKTECSVEMYDSIRNSWFTMTASLMEESRPEQYLLCKSDVTAFLERVKGNDPLTGALSYEKFRAEALRTISSGSKSYMILFMGIQDFSRINDEYGYEAGDQVLKSFANVVKKNLNEGELLCRIKGDDFVVLAEQENEEKVRQIVSTITAVLTALYRKRYLNVTVNCFGGIYEVQKNERYISRCLDNAMKARQVALENYYETGGIYTYTKEYELKENENKALEWQLKDAIKAGRFKVLFQPKIDAVTDRLIGAEALVRLIDKDNHLIPPGKFIPIAEKSGLIVEIDKFVYEQTFLHMKKWKELGKKIPLISVNMSRLHLMNDDLPLMIKELSDKYQLDPGQIELEITESVFFEDTDRLIKMIKKLKDMGYVISMDDFGAGFSTLSLMKSLPVDIVKIDGSFFMKSELDEKNKAVIASIMQLAKNLKFETVSEGVETKEQVEFIKSQGGKFIQGFYYYQPMCAEEFEKLLDE